MDGFGGTSPHVLGNYSACSQRHKPGGQAMFLKVVPKPPKWMVGLEPGREGIWL